MNIQTIYYVVQCPGGFFISDGDDFLVGDVVVFEGSWEACRRFIDPWY